MSVAPAEAISAFGLLRPIMKRGAPDRLGLSPGGNYSAAAHARGRSRGTAGAAPLPRRPAATAGTAASAAAAAAVAAAAAAAAAHVPLSLQCHSANALDDEDAQLPFCGLGSLGGFGGASDAGDASLGFGRPLPSTGATAAADCLGTDVVGRHGEDEDAAEAVGTEAATTCERWLVACHHGGVLGVALYDRTRGEVGLASCLRRSGTHGGVHARTGGAMHVSSCGHIACC